MDIKDQAAQGDVLIRSVAAIPATATQVPLEGGRVVLAHGEVTGHAHAIHRGAVMFRDTGSGSGGTYLQVGSTGAEVVHEEHSTLRLAPGAYEVIRQSEWSDEREPRRVAD